MAAQTQAPLRIASDEAPAASPPWALIAGVIGGTLALLVAGVLALIAIVVVGGFVMGMLTFMLAAQPEPPPPALFAAPAYTTAAPVVAAAPAPSLRIAVNQTGRKSFEVVNLSNRDYTNVTIVMNGEFQYRLKKLKNNAGDAMRYANFRSRRDGSEPGRSDRLRSMVITSDQGRWSQSF